MEQKIVKEMVYIPSPLLASDIILIILSISENNIARFLCFWLMASSISELCDDSYFEKASSFRRTATSTLADSKTSRTNLQKSQVVIQNEKDTCNVMQEMM